MIKNIGILILTVFVNSASLAAEWVMEDSSKLGFSARQQRAAFEGVFENFAAQIVFDPSSPETGRIKAQIDMASVNTDYAERDEYLRDFEWFFIESWPTGMFGSDDIVATEEGFLARGTLKLRGISQNVELRFTFDQTDKKARFIGTADLLRLDFDIGTGDWRDTEQVANEVTVKVDLQLLKQL